MNEEETVVISKKEYDDLLEAQLWLQCLENAGVDNWAGISFAHDLKREQENE
tara:strand:+ start:324 stop:479 length:156 start_codon:yes stop_codon:yes gene_type:complete